MLTLSQASAIVNHALAYARAHDLAPITVAALDAPGENRSGSAAGRSRVAPAVAERRNLIGAGSELNFD